MRKVLYRGFTLSNADAKGWVYGSLVEQKFLNSPESEYYICDKIMQETFLVDPDSISQDSTILDRRNNHIFEGDIVKLDGEYSLKGQRISIPLYGVVKYGEFAISEDNVSGEVVGWYIEIPYRDAEFDEVYTAHIPLPSRSHMIQRIGIEIVSRIYQEGKNLSDEDIVEKYNQQLHID